MNAKHFFYTIISTNITAMKNCISIVSSFLLVLLASCSSSPEKAFGIAALNCNQLYGFAGSGMQQQLASPSVKLTDEKTMHTEPMKRKEVVETKIQQVEENYEKVKSLRVNNENKEMIAASLALYEYTLPVLKKEYQELAMMYDAGVSKDTITAMEHIISDMYEKKFDQLYSNVVSSGTAYAEKHGIRVRTVNPAPAK